MNIANQTKILSGLFGMTDSVTLLAESGFDCIDVTFSEPDLECWLKDTSYNKQAAELKKHADALGVCFHQAHAPTPSDGADEAYNQDVYQKILRTIELSSILGIQNVVLHPRDFVRYLGTYEETRDRLRGVNLEFFNSLLPYCKDYNVGVVVENTYWGTDNGIEQSYCSNAKDIVDLVDTLDSPYMGACLDLGHLALAKQPHDAVIAALDGNRLKCLHVQDNEGVKDIHLLPGLGTVDYDMCMRSLAQIDYQGVLTLESYGFIKGFEKAFLPQVLKFMATRARFLAEQFEMHKKGM